jgi:putative phage-type endonuclease
MAERRKRLTASDYGMICKSAEPTKKGLADQLTTSKSISSRAIRHGLTFENVAVSMFEQLVDKKVTPCGLFVSLENPFLGATPDGLVDDDAVIEVKCPYSAKDSVVNPGTVPYLTYDENNVLQLKTQHNYYFQIQGQLYCSDRQICYFCIYTQVDFKVVVIRRDQSFITDMIEKLKDFYEKFFKPTVLEKMLYKEHSKFFC